jgi:hypothetical protein
MKPPRDPRGDVIVSAALGALVEARWHAQDLLSRKARDGAPALLRGLAGEKAFSPVARDQLLSVALGVAAETVEHGGDLHDLGVLDVLDRLNPAEGDRLAIRRQVFDAGPPPTTESRQVVETLEARYRPDCRSARELAKHLRAEASLHELLWDHPRLGCDSGARLAMLFAIPRLLERAGQLDPKGTAAGWRSMVFDERRGTLRDRALGGLFAARGWIRRPLLGVLPAGWVAGLGIALAAASTGLLAEVGP